MKKRLIVLMILGLSFTQLLAYGDSDSSDPLTTFPIGIVADGNNYGNNGMATYEVNANGISGSLQLNSISTSTPQSGTSLQLNAVLHVVTTNGTVDYWTQNVFQIYNTDYKSAGFLNNIWKFTDSNEPLVECVKIPFLNHNICKTEEWYYRDTSPFVYQLPFSTTLVMTEKVIPQKGVQIEFMHIEHGNTKVYDQRLLTIPNIISASFLITSNETMANYLSYDAEFVWGGKSNYETANFISMDSILNLQYQDTDSNIWKPFPSYSSHGFDTGETAQNIYSTIETNFPGFASIGSGNGLSQNNLASSTTITNESQTSQPTVHTPTTSQPICFLNGVITDCSIVQSTPQTTPQLTLATIPYTSTFVVSGTNFQVGYIIPSGRIVNMETDPKSQSLIISIEAYQSDQLTIDLPRSLIKIGDQSTVLVDGKNGGYGSTPTQDGTALYIDFPKGAKKIEIFGSYVTVPEFGPIAGMVIMISIIGSLVLSRRCS